MAETPDGAAIRVSLAKIPNGMGYNSLALIQMSGYGRRSRRTVLSKTLPSVQDVSRNEAFV
jgi:hypothetical protein